MDRAGQYHTSIAKSTHHKGPRNAGNKSLIGFRAGHGVCGYAGYIPSNESIPIPTKEGPSSNPGPNADRRCSQPGWVLEENAADSEYQKTICKSAIAKRRPETAPTYITQAPPRGPASPPNEDGVVIESQDDMAVPTTKFLGTSTYKTGFANPLENKRVQKDFLQPPSKNALRKRPAFMHGSTYGGTYENSVEIHYGQGWMEEKHRALASKPKSLFAAKWREVVAQRGPVNSSYQTDFGTFGGGLAAQLPTDPLGYSAAASTANLFIGTNKAFARVPGYTGFLPSSEENAQALDQAQDHTATNTKNCRLFTLNQFKMQIPGTSSFQPRDAENLKKPSKGRTGTTTGFNNALMSDPGTLAALAHKRSQESFFGSKNGTATFFQGGQLSVSENGVKNAEAFYRLLRPFEGRPRVLIPSKTTDSGYLFGCYRDVV